MIEQAIIGLLSNTSVIAAAVGANGIWGVSLPEQAVYPLILIKRISAMSDLTIDLRNNRQVRLQIEAWDTTLLGAQTLGEDIQDVLDGYAGTPLASDGTNPDANILSCILVNSLDMHESESRKWRRIADYIIKYT